MNFLLKSSNFVLFTTLLSFCVHSSAAVLNHEIEIGLYQKDKQTKFIKNLDVLSPKSVDFIDNKMFINALEKGSTLVYNTNNWTLEKKIDYQFKNPEFVKIKNFPYSIHNESFLGKPVEFTHFKNTAFIPFYRLSWDSNSRYHSAIAQVDLSTLSIKNIIPSGSIPKMVRVSSDGQYLVNSHWGDNTVGIYYLDTNQNISDYHYVVIDKKLNTENISGDRDKNCGYCLRGTVITPDNKYAIIGRMGGGGLAVINLQTKSYIGTLWNVPLTPRHLVISSQNDLVLSTCASGEIAKLSLDSIYKHIHELENKTNVSLKRTDWKSFNAGGSVRTIDLSKDGKYIYAALNTSSELAVIDYQSFKLIEKFKIANYPVGLAVSPDDKYIAVTQQGKSGNGGNHVDIFTRNN